MTTTWSHVSGHPARDELRKLYKLVRPKFAVPVHGEWRHLSAHAALAKEMGIEPLMMEDGDILQLFPGRPEVIDSAPVGRLALDGNRVVPLQGGVMAARRRMLFNGVVVGSVAVDATGRMMGQAQDQRAGAVRAGGSGERARGARFRPWRSANCRRRCGGTMWRCWTPRNPPCVGALGKTVGQSVRW